MDKPPPFDTTRAAFYLIAAVLTFQCVVIVASLFWCMSYASSSILSGEFECDKGGRLSQLLSNALAAAIALYGGGQKRND